MNIGAEDRETLRELAEKYAEIAHLDVQKERLERYRKTNDLEPVRPIVLIDEVPWGEIKDDLLVCTCADELRWLEGDLRRTLYQWQHFQVDLLVPPVFRINKALKWVKGTGLEAHDTQIRSETGTHITAHAYEDMLQTEEDIEKLHEPVIEYNKEYSEECYAVGRKVFDGLMDVELVAGHNAGGNIWDDISRYRGVESLLMDLAMRPDFMHKIARKFTDIAKARNRQMVEQGLVSPKQYTIHCTPAVTSDLPADDFDGEVRMKDIWGRCAAQIFGEVSPAMHDEFDLAYAQELFGECGLVYYGCCEPMDRKIDILRNRFKNLRKVSITPWADPKLAAENIGSDFVFAAKPNPAFVAMPDFRPEPVEEEIAACCEACKANGTTLEFVLKDISTVSNNPGNLTKWAETVNGVIDRFYS